ncbi:hypothetical protein AKJ16_DCAP20488 [Drosera capensis]
MKIMQGSAGILTNYEVLELLRSRGASKDATRLMSSLKPSELKVYDYLVETVACNQTTNTINEFRKKCSEFDLAPAEILNIVNTHPYNRAFLYPILEACDSRFSDEKHEELANVVAEFLPLAPHHVKPDEGALENKNDVESENNSS